MAKRGSRALLTISGVWDKSFFRTDLFSGLDHLRTENFALIDFHNLHHR